MGLSAADEPQALTATALLTRNPGTSFVAESQDRVTGPRRALVKPGLPALRKQGVDKCPLMVFADNTQGASFRIAIGATRRNEPDLCSLPTAPR